MQIYIQLHDNISTTENNINSPQKHDSEFSIMMSSVSTSISPNTFRDAAISTATVDLTAEGSRCHQVKNIASSQMNDIHHTVTPESLDSKWNVGLERSTKTIKVTTQMGI